MPNYFDMSGEAASASAQQTTGAENGPTAETVGAKRLREQEQNKTRTCRDYIDTNCHHPSSLVTGDYSQNEEWRFKLQAYLGLIDRDFDLVLQLAQVTTRQIENTDIRTHILDPTQASTAVDLSRDLHHILINICQGAAATVVRQNRYNANGCETLRFSLPVGARSVGYLTKLLEPTFNDAQFEEQFLQWEYDINRYEKDNGTAPPDGIKIEILLNKTKGALLQHLQLRAGQITNYIEIRAVILDYDKTISAFSRSTSEVSTNYNGGAAPMDVDNIWRKGRNYKGKGKGKGHYKGSKSKGKYRSKGRYKGFDKGNKGSYNKGGYNKSKGKGYSGSKDMAWDWYYGHFRQAQSLLHKHKSKSLLGKKTTHTTSWNDHSESFQQFLQEDTTQLHFDIAAATQQQRNKKIEDTITHYIMYSNFKSYHHLLIDSGASTHVCPEDCAPDLPLRPCGESDPQLYTVTNKKIPVYGIKYVPYKKDNFRIMIPCYVCDVMYPILSASRLLDRGYGLDFNPRHCTITHGQQQAHLIRHKAKQQQEQIAPLTKDCDRSLVSTTDYWKLDGGCYTIRVHKRPRKALFTPHNSACPIPEGELDDWRLTIINRQGQEQEQLQENPTQLSKQELQRRLEGDNWTGETRLRRKITPTRRATSKTTPTRQSSQPQRLMDTPPTRPKIQLRAPQKIWRPKAAPSTDLDTTQPKETIHRPLTAQEDNQDYWERQGEHWIRHHTTLRTTLFTPTHGPGHPPTSTLEPHRTTITHNNFGEVSQREDDWTVMGNAALPFQWKGTTRFTVKKDNEYIQENHDEGQQHEHHEAHRARGLRQPQQPTPQQIAEHNLTHLLYRNWCPICVQGKDAETSTRNNNHDNPSFK